MKFLFLILVLQAAVLEQFLCVTVQVQKKWMWCCMKALWPMDGKNSRSQNETHQWLCGGKNQEMQQFLGLDVRRQLDASPLTMAPGWGVPNVHHSAQWWGCQTGRNIISPTEPRITLLTWCMDWGDLLELRHINPREADIRIWFTQDAHRDSSPFDSRVEPLPWTCSWHWRRLAFWWGWNLD